MIQTFSLRFPEQAYLREALFAIELVDAVTLSRISDGVRVTAEGLRGQPIVNSGGLFVWRREDLARLTKVAVDPGALPYERVERLKADLHLPPTLPPLTTIELPPRVDYQFAPGITGIRGTLLEDRNLPLRPVAGAEVHLRWLDVDGNWRDAPTTSRTDARGDFVSIARLNPSDIPLTNAALAMTVRLHVRRDADNRRSSDLQLPQGHVASASTLSALTFAWDDLLP